MFRCDKIMISKTVYVPFQSNSGCVFFIIMWGFSVSISNPDFILSESSFDYFFLFAQTFSIKLSEKHSRNVSIFKIIRLFMTSFKLLSYLKLFSFDQKFFIVIYLFQLILIILRREFFQIVVRSADIIFINNFNYSLYSIFSFYSHYHEYMRKRLEIILKFPLSELFG